MNFNKLALTVAMGLSGLLVTAGAAFAVPAEARIAVNVRTGPAITYTRVDTLTAGEAVDVVECDDGWCYVDYDGPNGWVSASYLQAPSAGPAAPTPPSPNCSFQFTIGPGGPSLNLVCNDPPAPPAPTPPPPPPAPGPDLACFFTGTNFTGTQFCLGVSTLNSLGGTFNDNISSVQLSGNAKARLCVNNNLGGFCRNIFGSEPAFGAALENNASSLQVFTGLPPAPVPPAPPPPPPAPVTFSTGPIALQQTFSANLDNGNVGSGPQADIWYEAENAISKFLTPRNGARLALGDGTNRGFAGCSAESFSNARVSIWTMPVGTYVCARTNQGRISQFRLNGYTGTTMNLGYTTWQ